MLENHVAELVDLLHLERLEDNLFRGQSRDIGTKFVFGGQVLGQALAAAQNTVDPAREAHSLHAYFLRAGDIDAPIVYNVERTRDGGSFSSRGHYVSFVKKAGEWYECDDASVTHVTEKQVAACQAYLLFYQNCSRADADDR
ncbi:MAG: hypothetical protein WDW36_002870 [Sanguina aurantia]